MLTSLPALSLALLLKPDAADLENPAEHIEVAASVDPFAADEGSEQTSRASIDVVLELAAPESAAPAGAHAHEASPTEGPAAPVPATHLDSPADSPASTNGEVVPRPRRGLDVGPDAADTTLADGRMRKGLTFATTLGAASCPQSVCTLAALASGGRLGVGVRARRLQIGLDASYARGRFVAPGDFEADNAHMTLFDVLVDARWYLIEHHRLEPYVGLGLGFFRLRWALSEHQWDGLLEQRRGVVRASAGFDVRVGERLMVGPRFDKGLTFSGTECISGSNIVEECRSLPKDYEAAATNATERAQFRRALPRPWSFMVEARVLIF